jgi:hypothetical protein
MVKLRSHFSLSIMINELSRFLVCHKVITGVGTIHEKPVATHETRAAAEAHAASFDAPNDVKVVTTLTNEGWILVAALFIVWVWVAFVV